MTIKTNNKTTIEMVINLIQIKKISVKNMYFSSNAKRNEFSNCTRRE